MFLYNSLKSKELDQLTIKNGISGFLLMMRASKKLWTIAEKNLNGKVYSICGSGNNAGDAYGVASLALMDRKEVKCISLSDVSGDAFLAKQFYLNLGGKILKKLPKNSSVKKGDIIIDGIFGSGLARRPQGKFANAINWINNSKKMGAKILSVDLPSGINASNGIAFNEVVKADFTMMCLSKKQGCYTGDAPNFTGKLFFDDLGCKNYKIKPSSYLIKKKSLDFPKHNPTSYKGSKGKLLVLGGWDNMEGAGCLAGLAGLKTGAGKVYICGPSFKSRPLELIGIEKNIDKFRNVIDKVDAIVAGPGLGNNANTFLQLSWESNKPLVLDADGLIWLANERPKKRKVEFIGTPHLGEAKILLKQFQKDRFKLIHDLFDLYGGKWVLKGAGTITGPNPIFVNPYSDQILGTAGSGDVLAGIIGGFLSQKTNNASNLGVWVHSKCAKEVAKKKGKTLVASDLIDVIGNVIKK